MINAQTESIKILLVEDDQEDAILLEEYLCDAQDINFSICHLVSLSQLKSHLKQDSNFDVIILDLGLGTTVGIETFRAFKKLKLKIPVIIATGLDDKCVGLQAINEGAQDYLVKGKFNGDAVIRSIRYAIARYQIEEKLINSNKELRRLKNNLEDQVADTVRALMEKDSMLISRSQQALTGELVSNIVNQWKQPLNSLTMIIQTIKDAFDYKELTAKKLQTKTQLSIELINYLSRTIDDFRDYFKPKGQKQQIDISPLLEKAIGFVQYSLESESIDIQLRADANCQATGYPNELCQVVINIINNAREIIISRNLATSQRVIYINAFCNNGKSYIEIKDEAGGIKAENLLKIFEPTYTTKSEKGTGVGLYIAKNLIEKHMGGIITANNTPKGAKFLIEL